MPPKRSSTSEASTMSQAAIRKLVADSIAAALDTQTSTMAEADNPIRNTRPREIPVAKRGNYKEFIRCQPFYFNGTEGVVGLIRCRLPRSIEGNVTASKPQTLEEAINIAQRTSVTIVRMISVNNKIEGQKLLDPMLLLQMRTVDILETVHYVRDVPYITQDLAQLGVESATREKRHYQSQCSKRNINANGRTYLLRDKNAHQDPNVVTDEKRLENIPVVKEFPDVFPEELPGLPPVRQVEFQIDLIPRATPIARAPYRLAPSEMQEGTCKSSEDNFGITQKGEIGEDQEMAFQILKQKLCEALILALPEGNNDFVVYCDASI
nr:putative reverse transcriptase domain-containing protein [Tanacetum cinerariifolium]